MPLPLMAIAFFPSNLKNFTKAGSTAATINRQVCVVIIILVRCPLQSLPSILDLFYPYNIGRLLFPAQQTPGLEPCGGCSYAGCTVRNGR